MKLSPFVKILRPVNLLITFLSVWGGVIIAEEKLAIKNYADVLTAAIAAALINGAGNVINDIFDKKTDAENNKNRPLVTGDLSLKAAVIYYVTLNLTALISVYFVSETLFFIALATVVLLFVYSWFLKQLPLMGNMLVAFITGLVFLYAGALSETWWRDFVPFFFAIQINLIREITKDLEDIYGDVRNKIFTVAFYLEEKGTKIFVAFLTLLLIVTTLAPYYFFNYKIEYLIVVLFFTDLPLIVFLKKLFERKPNYKTIHLILKSSMIFGLVAILLGVL